jgi:predicted Zn finger-like uncharacterized protein
VNIQKTRCPHCSSIFTVSDTQLSIRDGYTRCGKCFKVFKADDYLLVEREPVVTPATPTLFDDVAPVLPTIAANTKGAAATHIADLSSLEQSKPAAVNAVTAAEDKLASTLNDQPLATLARMLANELSLLQPQPLMPIAAPPPPEPVVVEAEPEEELPEFAPTVDVVQPLIAPSPFEVPAGTAPPVMSHIFEQEFNDLWLSATDHSKPLASAVATSTAAEQQRNAAATTEELDSALTEHFDSSDSDLPPIGEHPVVATPQPVIADHSDLSDIMAEMPSISAQRATEEEPADEEDLFSYLNKNNVAAAPASLRPKRILPGMQETIKDPKTTNKTTNRSSIAPHPRQPGSKRTALPPIKRPNLVMERLTKPIPFFNLNIPKTLAWGFLSLLMLLLLGIQFLYFNFDKLAGKPEYSASLKSLCDTVGCEVPVVDVRKIKLINKQAASYSAAPTESTRFSATMLNGADASQPYPILKLAIRKNGQVVSGRMIKPSEYLPGGFTALTKIPANTPIKIEFVLKIPHEQVGRWSIELI